MTTVDILVERERLWAMHPLITESAILPTRPVQSAVKRVLGLARKARSSMAFWADPVTGKSSCLRAIEATVLERIPGCGVLVLEAVEDSQSAEGRLLIQILKQLDYAHKIDSTLAGKRDQVHRALMALAGTAGHLFLLIDEAQEVSNNEFAWLKAVINGLSRKGLKVTTILFGQRELKKRRDQLYREGRSDLGERFMKMLIEFKKCCAESDLLTICEAIDCKSEYPVGSGWTYTQLLFPRAFRAGFRIRDLVPTLWAGLHDQMPRELLARGLPMELVASVIANLCLVAKDLDDADMSLSPELIGKAIKVGIAG